MTTGFDYGNARVRAMRSRMLSGHDFGELVAANTLEQILGALDDTEYGPDIEVALTRYRGQERYDRALSRHLARTLSAVRSFYEGEARHEVDLLLLRHDLDNLVTIVRGQAALPGSMETAALLVAAGTLDRASLEELARQPGLRETVELLVAWGVPTPATARSVLHAWSEYERVRDVGVLETALTSAFADRIAESLDTLPTHLAIMLESWIDTVNILTSLRLRRAKLAGEPTPDGFEPLAGGRVSDRVLAAVDEATSADAAAILSAGSLLPGWDTAFEAWASHQRIDILADELEAARTRWAIGLFHRGDPLSIDVPLAYVSAKENEVRNLRLVGQGCAHGVPPEDIQAALVIP
jgi:V/A-type H+/Na+-transporting ATPase subunit C